MAEDTVVPNTPTWVDLSSTDPAASRIFYARLFGWQIEVAADPQFGGYALAQLAGKDVAGIGPTQSPDAPSAWMVYIGSADAEEVAERVEAAGGNVVARPFDVADQGRIAVFRDPTGAFISTWQPKAMAGFGAHGPNTFAWAELSARNFGKAVPFYAAVFGWTAARREMEGAPPYTEFQLAGQSIAGGMEMNPQAPAQVPSYWMVYFGVEDVAASFRTAIEAGAHEMLAPRPFPGGQLAILSDPQGAPFGLIKMEPRQ